MFFILFSLFAALPAGASYTIDDLIILSQTGEHQEFIDHAKDIKPTKRDQRWKRLVSKQAELLIDNLRNTKSFSKKNLLKIEKLALWPTLHQDEFFQVKRNSYSLQYFKHCFLNNSKKENCAKDLKLFWMRSNKDPDTGHKLSLLLRGFTPKQSAWPVVKDIILSSQSQYYCNDAFIQETVHKKLSSIDLEKRSSSARKILLQNLAHLKCWNKLIPYLKEEISLLPSAETSSLYYALIAFKQMNQTQKDLWLTKYLLDDPRQGPLLNSAWYNLKELSQHFERRIAVLNRLKALSPLPGDSFNNLSLAITRHFNKYFPEYITAYAKTCLSYLEGTRSFQFGNPTVHCDSLFKRNKYEAKSEFLGQSLSSRYSAIKKL